MRLDLSARTAKHRRIQQVAPRFVKCASRGRTANARGRRCACFVRPEKRRRLTRRLVMFVRAVAAAVWGTLYAHRVLRDIIRPPGTTAQYVAQGSSPRKHHLAAETAKEELIAPSVQLRVFLATPELMRHPNQGRVYFVRQEHIRRSEKSRVIVARTEKSLERALPFARCAKRESTQILKRATYANLVPAEV